MDQATKWDAWFDEARPTVCAKVRQLAGRHRLPRADRDDLQQQIYLALLAGGAAAGLLEVVPDDGAPSRPPDDGRPERQHVGLMREVDRIAEGLVRSQPYGRRERPIALSAVHRRLGRRPPCRADARDLQLDVATALARLPDDLRGLCHRILLDCRMAGGDLNARDTDAAALSDLAARAGPLRPLFRSMGLHHYL